MHSRLVEAGIDFTEEEEDVTAIELDDLEHRTQQAVNAIEAHLAAWDWSCCSRCHGSFSKEQPMPASRPCSMHCSVVIAQSSPD